MDNNIEPGIPEFLGSMVDNLFLLLPKMINLFKPKRNITRSEYESHLDFYIQKGFIRSPESFFTFPCELSQHETIQRRPFLDGEYQLIALPSLYEPVNPFIREYYLSFHENKTSYIARWTHGRHDAKTLLCLHGYLLGEPRQAERMFKIKKMFEQGLDVALFITPFHWRRAPASRAQRGIYLRPDNVIMTCECVGQTMYDLTAACSLLKHLGSINVGLLGASLGGYISALFVCLQSVVDFAAMMVPAVSFLKPLGPDTARLPFPVGAELAEKMRMVYELHSPLHFQPKISKDHLLIIASRGDRFCPFESVRLLCERWAWPEHHFLRGGHWLIFNNRVRGRAWYEFLSRMGYLSIQDS